MNKLPHHIDYSPAGIQTAKMWGVQPDNYAKILREYSVMGLLRASPLSGQQWYYKQSVDVERGTDFSALVPLEQSPYPR